MSRNGIIRVLSCTELKDETIERLGDIAEITYAATKEPKIGFDLANAHDVIIIRSPFTLSKYIAENASTLKMVIRAGSGLSGLYADDFEFRGVPVHRIPLASRSVAEHVFALAFSIARDVLYLDTLLKNGHWGKRQAKGTELYGKNLHVIGYGSVGQNIATIGSALGMNIIVSDPSLYKMEKQNALKQLPNSKTVELDEGIQLADFCVLSCSLNETSRNLIDNSRLGLFKSSAVLINVGRGELVDIDALIDALDSRRLYAAGLDVHQNEPFVAAKHVASRWIVSTPHIGAQTIDARKRIELKIVELLERFHASQNSHV